jgi:glycosyltransferase involved in cell wall biosynthesis
LNRVSIIVATRNRADQLRECLDAIAAQTYGDFEVVVADDGSNEATRRAYSTMSPALTGRLRWLLQPHPDAPGTGPAAARNRGLAAATGAFVAFCDDDDRWIRTDHLACGVQALEKTGADFFFTDVVATRGGVTSDHVWFPDRARLEQGMPVAIEGARVFAVDRRTTLDVVAGRVIHPDCWVVRKSLLDEVGGFWERLWFPEDYNLMMRLLDRAASILFRSEPCVDYRLPVESSHSLRSSPIETILQETMAAQHVRVLCRTAEVRQHARAREAWGLRRLARELRAQGHRSEARRFARQGLFTYPTARAVIEWIIG